VKAVARVCAALVVLLASCSRADLRVLGGNLSAANGEYARATATYLAALDGAPREAAPYVLYDLGNVYAALGEPAAARDTIGRALEGSGVDLLFRARFNLGCLEYEQGRYQQAAENFVEALRQRPGDVEAKANLELALKRLKGGGAAAPAPAERGLDRRTSNILDIARKKEAQAWNLEPSTKPPQKGDDW
jgi:tetratricopeptide (TPR) repeat protein